MTPRYLSVGCKCIPSSFCTWTQGDLTCVCSLRFQSLVRTVPEESECIRFLDVGPGQGFRHPCVSTFKDATSGPSQKTPRKGIEFLQPSGWFEWDTTLDCVPCSHTCSSGRGPESAKGGRSGSKEPQSTKRKRGGSLRGSRGKPRQRSSRVPRLHQPRSGARARSPAGGSVCQDVTWCGAAELADRRRAKLWSRPPQSRGAAGAA